MDNNFKYLFVIRNGILKAYDYNNAGALITLNGNHNIDMEKIEDFWPVWEDKAGYISGHVDFLILDNGHLSETIQKKYTIQQDLSWTLSEVSNMLNEPISITNNNSIQIGEEIFTINMQLEPEIMNSTIPSDEITKENTNTEHKYPTNSLAEILASNIKNS